MYVPNGLLAWEGIAPGMRTGPAGPQTWIGWFYAAGRSGWELLRQQWSGQKIPLVLRPFTAVEQALFKTYEDLSGLRQLLLWISLIISLAAVYGGYRLGRRYGGTAGGLLIGGWVAVLPLYIEFSGIAKSCSDAWMLGILAVACAATVPGPKYRWLPGALLGLAIGSRIDMLLVVPLVLWALWDHEKPREALKRMLTTLGLTVACALLSAPWAVEGFVGMMRNIGMSRVAGYWNVESPRLATLKDLVWEQGLGPALLAAGIGVFMLPGGTRLKGGVLAGFALLMAASMFAGGRYMYMRYHGGPLIAFLVCTAVTAGAIWQRWPKAGVALVACSLVLPLIQSVRAVIAVKSSYVPDGSTEWIEQHVPPGTTVYLDGLFISRAVLPTEAAADTIWRAMADNEPWRLKLQDGFSRFSLREAHLPRAMSEDNLVMDRGLLRRWFILGGGHTDRPRYDVRLLPISPTLRFLDKGHLLEEFKRTGGVMVRRSPFDPEKELGEPLVQWVNREGRGTWIFVSPDVRGKLRSMPWSQEAGRGVRKTQAQDGSGL